MPDAALVQFFFFKEKLSLFPSSIYLFVLFINFHCLRVVHWQRKSITRQASLVAGPACLAACIDARAWLCIQRNQHVLADINLY